MSTSASPAAGTAPATPATPAVPQIDLSKLSVQQLNELQAQPGAATPPAVAAPPSAPVAPAVEPVAPATPAVPPTPDTPPPPPPEPEPSPDPTKIGRFRLEATNFKDAEVMRLIAKSQAEARQDPNLRPLTLPEAIERVYGQPRTPVPTNPAQPPETPADPVAQIKTEIGTRTQALTAIDAKLEKAADEMDMKAIVALNKERQQAVLDLDRLNRRAVAVERRSEQVQMEQATNLFRQREREYTREAMKAYPVLADKANPERAEFDRFVMQKADDTDFAAVFDSPRWPAIMAREFAEARGLRPTVAASTATTPAPAPAAPSAPVAPPPVVPAAVRATSATVITPGADGVSGATPSAEQLAADIASGKFTLKQLDELMAKGAARS